MAVAASCFLGVGPRDEQGVDRGGNDSMNPARLFFTHRTRPTWIRWPCVPFQNMRRRTLPLTKVLPVSSHIAWCSPVVPGDMGGRVWGVLFLFGFGKPNGEPGSPSRPGPWGRQLGDDLSESKGPATGPAPRWECWGWFAGSLNTDLVEDMALTF